jgi:hypothetical protein
MTVTDDLKNEFFARFSLETQLFFKQKLFSGVFDIVEFIYGNNFLKLRRGFFFTARRPAGGPRFQLTLSNGET